MSEYQITELMNVSLENIKEMLKVGVILGDPITIGEELIIPVSKVKCGFVSGGVDHSISKKIDSAEYPFGGGAAGTISLTPIAFLAYNQKEVKVLHLTEESHILEKVIDGVNGIVNKIFKDKEKS